MQNLTHATLGRYALFDADANRIYGSTKRRGNVQQVIVPAGIPLSAAGLAPGSAGYQRAYTNPLMDILYADMLTAHPDAVLVMGWQSKHVDMPKDLMDEADVYVTLSSHDGLTLELGRHSYRVRKASDRDDLRKRLANAVKSLRAMHARTKPALGRALIDGAARWILANIRPHVVEEVSRTLSDWADNPADHIAKHGDRVRLDIESGDVVGMPHSVRLSLNRQHVITGFITTAGGHTICTSTFHVGDIPDAVAAALAGRPATDVIDHPMLKGRTIGRAVVNSTRVANGETRRYTTITLEAVDPEPFDASMIAAVAYAPGEAEAIVERLVSGLKMDPIAAWAIRSSDQGQMATRLHRIIDLGQGDLWQFRHSMRFVRAKGGIVAVGTLAPNAIWESNAVKITDLPESVMMTLRAKALGRPARDIVDHAALDGHRVRAVHLVRGKKRFDGTMEKDHIALHLEPMPALAMAA